MRILNSELADTLGNLMSRASAKSLNPKQIFPKIHGEEFEELLKEEYTQVLVGKLKELSGNLLNSFSSHRISKSINFLQKNVILNLSPITFT